MSKKMVSPILTALLACASMQAEGDLPDYAKKLVLAVQDVPEKDWEALSPEAQDYYNDLATAVSKGKNLPDPPDAKFVEEEPEKPAGRSRSRATVAGDTPAAEGYKPKRKDHVTVTTKRGKVVTGVIVEIDDKELVLDVDGTDEEFDRDRLESIVPVAAGKGAKEEPEPEDEAVPEVGDTVQVTTKRGKVVMGKITAITDDDLALELTDGSVDDYARDRLESIEVKAKGKAPAETKGGGRSKAGDDKGNGEKAPRTRATTEGGQPVTVRLRELIITNLDASKEDILKLAAKEKLEIKDNTAALTYAEVHKVVALLRQHKLMK